MENENNNLNRDDLKKLLEENLEVSKEIRETTRYIKRYIIWQQVFGFLKLLLIIVPMVIAAIYLPPLLKDVFKQYQNILGIGGGGAQLNASDLDIKSLSPDILKLLK